MRTYCFILATVSLLLSHDVFAAGPVHADLKGAARLQQGIASRPLRLRVFDSVWQSVKSDYYDSTLKGVNWEQLKSLYRPEAINARTENDLYKILNKMLSELRDGHTTVDSPTEMVHDKKHERFGLGITSEVIESRFVLTHVAKGSAADEAGILPGWIMTHWNGAPMDISKSRRPAIQVGQAVTFRFLDPENQEREVNLVARPFQQVSNRKAVLLEGGCLYIRMEGFDRGVGKWFSRVLEQYPEAPGCILDLRGSPGGFFVEMRDCLKPLFVNETVFGNSIQRDGKKLPLMVPGAGNKAYRGELIVLLDRTSYSAAEVFAAAIRDSVRGKIVGRKSGGVALLALHKRLPDGGEVSVSFRDYVTRSGERIEGLGVKPDVLVSKKLEDLRKTIDRDLEMGLDLLGVDRETLTGATPAPTAAN
jgi:carboxyl-terminal processing protease